MKIQLVFLGVAIAINYVVCGTIRSQCQMLCPRIYDPVCGSDSKTYANECLLRVGQCNDASLSLAHEGPCAALYRRMVCTTPMCWPIYEPVCGSDGITYGNGCHFSNAHCYAPDLKNRTPRTMQNIYGNGWYFSIAHCYSSDLKMEHQEPHKTQP